MDNSNVVGEERIIGVIDVTSYSDENGVYRSKVAGLYGIVVSVEFLEKIDNIEVGRIEEGCDSLRVIDRSFQIKDVGTRYTFFDLLDGLFGMVMVL